MRKKAGEQGSARQGQREGAGERFIRHSPLATRYYLLATRHLPLATFVLLTAAALRLIGLNNVSPPGLAHDEVANWLIDRGILAGNHAIYFTRAYGHEAGFHYVQAAFVALLGDHALALRLPAAFFGLLGVAVSYALTRQLFGRRVALTAAALLAVLFWPVFYSRLGLRAISLPFFSGLSAFFFLQGSKGAGEQGGNFSPAPSRRPRRALPCSPAFLLAGLFAGLSMHSYMASRALPIFYGLYGVYLLLWQRDVVRRQWRGLLWFTAVFALIAAPLFIYLQQNPGAEFRISEVDAPLRALRAVNVLPVLQNGLRIAGMFGFVGDPLWRQNVAGAPVFEPIVALLFYVGVGLALWRWRDGRYAFLLLWLGSAAVPSLVTINAPSSIRMINALPLLTVFPALLIHNLPRLSTVIPKLSTKMGKIVNIFILTIFAFYAWRTAVFTFQIWPNGGDVAFVWQAAMTEMADYLHIRSTNAPTAVAGWSPYTMDPPTLALLQKNSNISVSHFYPQEGTLLLPAADGEVEILRPTILELDPFWEGQLAEWGAMVEESGRFVHTTLTVPELQPQHPLNHQLNNEFTLFGYDSDCETAASTCQLITYWQIEAAATAPRRLFAQTVNANGELLDEQYRWDEADPQGLWFAHWQPGDVILQRHEIVAGATAVRLGIFDPTTCTPGPCQNLLTDEGEGFVTVRVE